MAIMRDISLAKKELGWEPKIQLDAGLKKTIAYFDKLLGEGGKGEEKQA